MELEALRESPYSAMYAADTRAPGGQFQEQFPRKLSLGGKVPSVSEEDREHSGLTVREGYAVYSHLHHRHRQTPGTPARPEPPVVTQWESGGFL